MKKRVLIITTIIIVAVSLLCFTGCSNGSEENATDGSNEVYVM